MAFLLFERAVSIGGATIHPTGEMFKLGGKNLIYEAWKKRGCPVDVGWHVSANELIQLHTKGVHNYPDRRLIIDFDPRSTWRIGLIELLDVYAFTWGDVNGGSSWTPLMLRLRDVFYKEFPQPLVSDEKERYLSEISDTLVDGEGFVEFLYLNGSKFNWNWGKNGMTNAVFIQGAAREYFKKYF